MVLPSSFAEFTGNRAVVDGLRASVAAGRLPHSLIVAGPRGAGKFTLALLLTMALECERQPRETAAPAADRACGRSACGRSACSRWDERPRARRLLRPLPQLHPHRRKRRP